MRGKLWSLALYLFVLGFILNLLGIVSHVTVSAFAKRWFGTPLPPQFTTDWFVYAWNNFDLGPRAHRHRDRRASVVVLALMLAYPAAYILARRNFRGKALLLLLYFSATGHSANDLWHFARHHALWHADRRNDLRRDPRKPRADGAARGLHLDSVLRADQPEPRVGRADARREPLSDLPPHPAAADRAGPADRGRADPGQHGVELRADVPGVRRQARRRWSSRCSTTCSPAACGRSTRSTPWR